MGLVAVWKLLARWVVSATPEMAGFGEESRHGVSWWPTDTSSSELAPEL